SPQGDVLIGHCAGPGEARVNVDHPGTSLLSLGDPLEPHGVAFGHVGPLDDDAVGVGQVLLGLCGAPSPKRSSQTGNCGRVSNASLVLDLYGPGGGEQLLDQVVFFVVYSRPAKAGNPHRPVQGLAVVILV